MKIAKFVRSALAMLLILASLVSLFPAAFAAEGEERKQITINAEDLLMPETDEEMDREAYEAAEKEYQDQIFRQLCDEYGISTEEEAPVSKNDENTEFGYLTDEECEELGIPYEPDTRDVRNEENFAYIFLDFKVGSASRTFNWQYNSDDGTAPYHSANWQGAIAADYKGTNPMLYLPIETDADYIDARLNSYKLKTGDIARVYINAINANAQFVSGGTKTADSYFAVHCSAAKGSWTKFGANTSIGFKTGAQTLTWNMYADLNGKTLYGLRWDPSQTELTESARIYVDYIYIGPPATAPVLCQFRNEGNTANLSGGGGYVGYGKKAPAFSTGQVNSEDSTSQTIWGWSIRQKVNGTWTDMNKFVTDPSTVTLKTDTQFVLTKVKIRKQVLNSVQTYTNGVSTEDDKYVLTVDGFDTAEMNLGGYGTPLDVAIVMDRSGSEGEFVWTKNFGANAKADLTAYLETLSKNVDDGYYRAYGFTRGMNDGKKGFDAYIYSMPLRYHNGDWQMQVLSGCDCNGSSYRDYGIYSWMSSGYKQCSHVKWKTVEAGYDQFVADAKATGYTVGSKYTVNGKSETLYFALGASRLAKLQGAIESFLIKLYQSTPNLKPGQKHKVSVIGYGASVFLTNYPYKDGNGKYKTSNNYNATIEAQALDYDTYESVLKVVNDTYIYGATRTDCAFQILSGTLSALEDAAGKTKPITTKTKYLANPTTGRKRIVILLTDGVPSSDLEFDATVANAAVKASALLKDDAGTKVYCIGVMNGLDSAKQTIYNDTTEAHRANDFLNAMSSRYRNAAVWNTGGTLTKGAYYFSDTAGGANIASQMGTIWNDNAATLAVSGKSGPASLWLYEEFSREWKPDPDGVVKIYAAPYTGNGTYGAKVQIGEHKVTSGATKQTYTGKGYKLHIEPFDDQRYACVLQWTDAKTAFLRETDLSTGSAATALSGTLNTKKGYKVFMEIPIEVDRNNTLGGNNIPLTTSASGCYQANSAADTGRGAKLYNYVQPNANVYCSVEAEAHDYFISVEDYIALLNGQETDKLKFVLDNMLRMPEKLKPANDHGLSNLDYVSFDVKLSAPDGTVLYHKAAAQKATSLTSDVYNISDTLANLKTDQVFTMVAKLTNAYSNTDSYGRAPYPNINATFYPTYYVPKFAVADFGDDISVPMGLEGQNASQISDLNGGTLNTDTNTMTFDDRDQLVGSDTGVTYTYTTANIPKGEASNEIARKVHIIPANVVTYDDSVIQFEDTWQTIGTKSTVEQTYDNTTIHGYEPKYNTTGDFHGSVRYAEVDATNTAKQGTFTFTGTGFELLSRTTPDSGVLVAEIFSGTEVNKDTLIKGILCNTYLATGSHTQVPVIRWDGDYGTYTVRVTALYNVAFAIDSTKHPITDAQIREIMGYGEDVDMTYIPSQGRVATRAGIRPSYRGYVDGVRIFNPVQSSPMVDAVYSMAGESIADFADMYNVVLDSTNWTGDQANGMLYLADQGINAEYGDTTSSEDGFPLLMEGSSEITIEKVTVNGEERTYYLNSSNARYTYNGMEFWSMKIFNEEGKKIGYGYFYDNPKPTADKPYLTLTRDQVRNILGTDAVYYSSAYKSLAAKGEVQLLNGSGVAFVGNGDKVYLSVKSANGKACKVQVWDRTANAWVDYKDPKGETPLTNVTSATEQFYDFSAYNKNGGVIIKNAGEGLLSIVHVKTSVASKGIKITKALAIEACKAFETPIAETVTEELKLSHSLNLRSNISVNYIVGKAAVADFDDYLLAAEVGGKSYIVNGVEKGELVYFTLDCLTAAQMNENITAQLKCYKDGETFTSPVDHYSIAAYAYTMMNKEGVSEALKSLCANLLRYGAATQTFLGKTESGLADEEMTEEQRAWLTDLEAVEFGNNYALMEDLSEATVAWVGKSLALDSTVAVKLIVNASAFAGDPAELELRVSYTDIYGESKELTLNPTVYNAENNLYQFTVDQLNAAELRTVLRCQVFANGEAVSQTMTYSGDSYGNGKTGTLLELCKALFAYVDQAKAVFAG